MIYRRCLAKHMFWVFENMTAAGEPKELTHSRALALSLSICIAYICRCRTRTCITANIL